MPPATDSAKRRVGADSRREGKDGALGKTFVTSATLSSSSFIEASSSHGIGTTAGSNPSHEEELFNGTHSIYSFGGKRPSAMRRDSESTPKPRPPDGHFSAFPSFGKENDTAVSPKLQKRGEAERERERERVESEDANDFAERESNNKPSSVFAWQPGSMPAGATGGGRRRAVKRPLMPAAPTDSPPPMRTKRAKPDCGLEESGRRGGMLAPLRLLQSTGMKVISLFSDRTPRAPPGDIALRYPALAGGSVTPKKEETPKSTVPTFVSLADAASSELGGRVLFATDDLLASADNLLSPTEPKPPEVQSGVRVFDGWVTRRRRSPGQDWCVIELAGPTVVRGIDVDVSNLGPHAAPSVSIEGANIPDLSKQLANLGHSCLRSSPRSNASQPTTEVVKAVDDLLQSQSRNNRSNWVDVLPMERLPQSSSHNYFEVRAKTDPSELTFTHLRLNLFPDGGVARLRVYGELEFEGNEGEEVDLASIVNGGLPLLCSDQSLGRATRLLVPSKPSDSTDAWETARTLFRAPVLVEDTETGRACNLYGEDWVIIRLGARGVVNSLEIDCSRCTGNSPDSCTVEAVDLPDILSNEAAAQRKFFEDQRVAGSLEWKKLLLKSRLRTDAPHSFAAERRSSGSTPGFRDIGPVTHIRLAIFPDGAVSRLRVRGRPEELAESDESAD